MPLPTSHTYPEQWNEELELQGELRRVAVSDARLERRQVLDDQAVDGRVGFDDALTDDWNRLNERDSNSDHQDPKSFRTTEPCLGL